METSISFENTRIAFANKTDKELKQAHWLFNLMNKAWLVKWGTRLTPWAIRTGLPVKSIIRKTIFEQFVGGETMEESIPVIQKLAKYNVQVILDYGAEGKQGEANFDMATNEFIRVIQFAATQPNVPFMSIKVTGFARFSLLEKIDAGIKASGAPTLVKRYYDALSKLDTPEFQEWERVRFRMEKIGAAAAELKVGFLVDAEETWIQDPVDALTMLMMDKYNRGRLIVYNTFQMYRHDRLNFLHQCHEAAVERKFLLGAKLVRGAYMEKERKRALEMGYPSPIQSDKQATDRDYNEALSFCINNLEQVGLIVASHNEDSNLLAVRLMQEKNKPLDHSHLHFSQLYGMSDNITFNLAKAGCSVSKYLPFGPIKDVIPYLMRRAQENTSVGGQTSRELALIEKELKNRKSK